MWVIFKLKSNVLPGYTSALTFHITRTHFQEVKIKCCKNNLLLIIYQCHYRKNLDSKITYSECCIVVNLFQNLYQCWISGKRTTHFERVFCKAFLAIFIDMRKKNIFVPSIVRSLARFMLRQKSKWTAINFKTPPMGYLMAGKI